MNHTLTNTPWGKPDEIKLVNPMGITWVSTPSHGGYYVPSAQVMAMPHALASLKPFAGACWYEEDCDAVIVPLAFPDLFPAEEVRLCESYARKAAAWWTHGAAVRDFLDSDHPTAQRVRAICQ